MKSKYAEYAVIRFIPDLARDEAVNVGIALWHKGAYRLRIDQAATERAIHESGIIGHRTLPRLESRMLAELKLEGPYTTRRFFGRLSELGGAFIAITDPRRIGLNDTEADPVAASMDRLINRLVRLYPMEGAQDRVSS